jgi:hypothetical protein
MANSLFDKVKDLGNSGKSKIGYNAGDAYKDVL